MNKVRVWSCFALSLGLVLGFRAEPAQAEPVRYDGHRLVTVTVRTPEEFALLQSLTDDIWTEHAVRGRLDVRVDPGQFERLRASGLPYEVKIDDLQRVIDEQMAYIGDSRDAFDDYLPYPEVLNYLDTLVALRPDLAETFVAGQSLQGREIAGIHITGPGAGMKPAVIYMGGQHAREWITVSAILYVADRLVRDYDSDPELQDLVDRFDWYLVPIVNPDGYVYAWNTERLWRKNRRFNPGSGCRGVDLNRNWSVGWGFPGASTDPCDETYRGTSPFSEPETQAIRDLILGLPHARVFCDIHSYSQLIMYPFGYDDLLPPYPDGNLYAELAATMSDIVFSVHGEFYDYGPVYTTIYPASGTSVDWAYVEGDTIAFTYELRDTGQYGFLLPPWQIRPNCEEVFPALMYLAAALFDDCNENGVWDPQDIAAGTSQDCNADEIPDECQVGGLEDCNANGLPDLCDIYSGYSPDCNANGVPDECDLAAGTSADCQPNGIPDECDLAPPDDVEAADDCAQAELICPGNVYTGSTENATNDGSAACGDSASAPDVWFFYRPYGNGYVSFSLCGSDFDTVLSVHTGCPGTIANQIACNDDYCGEQSRVEAVVFDGQPYWIRIAGRGGAVGSFQLTLTGLDCLFDSECNDNGIPDECEEDCNDNGRPDDCDLADGSSQDLDGNGIPDECEAGCAGQLPGDANCDGLVNAFDIDAFVLALTDADSWAAQFGGTGCDRLCVCDLHQDGDVNAFDIDPFVALLTGN